ncbi:MAG: biotin/lipoate A/B protein ligase family protein [Isosphaeraceae bacterium]
MITHMISQADALEAADGTRNAISCRVLAYEVTDGPGNMALDEALLDWVAGGENSAFLRTYGWTVPTLSLGYFQNLADAQAESRWASVPIVRRPTGGGAIWHEHELTYALVVPAEHPMARSRNDLYRIVHAVFAEFLRNLGAVSDGGAGAGNSTVGIGPKQTEHKRPLLCFTDRNPHDIVIGGFKVVGSAQRRRAGAVLQHGSLLLDRSDRTPELRGVRNVADIPLGPREWADHLVERIPIALGLRSIAAPLPDALRDRARQLAETKYRNPAWRALHP